MPAETIFKIMADGDFTFTSSSNPSAPGEAVTFTLSATGEADTPYGKLPPAGAVTFFADGNEIEGCSFLFLNAKMDENGEPIFGNYPATCTTDALAEGSHEISADYIDPFEVYNQPTLSLTQQVGVVESMTISPETLDRAAYQTPYSQQFTAGGGVEPYTFTLLNSSLPNGITLNSTGLLSGFADYPAAPGTYPITIGVMDANGFTASRNYDFTIDKGMPEVTIRTDTNISWHLPFSISADVLKQNSDGNFAVLDGTVAFYIDNIPVPGCDAVTEANGYYRCANVSMDLSVGTHTVRAEYSPTGWYTDYYNSDSASKEFTVQSRNFVIQGYLYGDNNQNAIKDPDESTIPEDGWTINLDENCDGVVDNTTTTSFGGFSFSEIPSGGQCYRLTVIAELGSANLGFGRFRSD